MSGTNTSDLQYSLLGDDETIELDFPLHSEVDNEKESTFSVPSYLNHDDAQYHLISRSPTSSLPSSPRMPRDGVGGLIGQGGADIAFRRLESRHEDPSENFLLNPSSPLARVSSVGGLSLLCDTSRWTLFIDLLYLAVPTMITCVLEFIPGLINVLLVGNYAPVSEVDAVALSSMTSNVFGNALGLGLLTAMDALCSQAVGAGNIRILGKFFKQGMLLTIFLVICVIIPLQLFAPYLLEQIGQPKDVCDLAKTYLSILLPMYVGVFTYECLRKVYQSQGFAYPMLIVAIASNLLQTGLAYFLITKTSLQYLSLAIARTVSAILMPILLILYFHYIDPPQKVTEGLYFFRKEIPRLFINTNSTEGADIATVAEKVMPILALYQIADGLGATLEGVLRGAGLQLQGAYIMMFAYWVCGIPLAYLLAFKVHMDLFGLWLGLTIGLALCSLLVMIRIAFANWKRLSEQAQERLLENPTRSPSIH
eukprot:g2560.t1